MKTLDYTAHVPLPFGASCRIAEDMVPLCNVSRKVLIETVIDAKQDFRFVSTKYAFVLEMIGQMMLGNKEFADWFKDEVKASLEEYYKNGFGEFADDILEDMDLKDGQCY